LSNKKGGILRWDDGFGPWMKEFVGQNVKNVVKKYFYVRR